MFRRPCSGGLSLTEMFPLQFQMSALTPGGWEWAVGIIPRSNVPFDLVGS